MSQSPVTSCPDDACAADCCVGAIKSLADAAQCCCDQYECHKKQGHQAGCDGCKEAFDLTLQAMQKHLDCLKGSCG